MTSPLSDTPLCAVCGGRVDVRRNPTIGNLIEVCRSCPHVRAVPRVFAASVPAPRRPKGWHESSQVDGRCRWCARPIRSCYARSCDGRVAARVTRAEKRSALAATESAAAADAPNAPAPEPPPGEPGAEPVAPEPTSTDPAQCALPFTFDHMESPRPLCLDIEAPPQERKYRGPRCAHCGRSLSRCYAVPCVWRSEDVAARRATRAKAAELRARAESNDPAAKLRLGRQRRMERVNAKRRKAAPETNRRHAAERTRKHWQKRALAFAMEQVA